MTRARRVDANQAEIVEALRAAGALVHCTHTVGDGFPDLVAAIDGEVFLLEIKSPGGRLTKAEQRFHNVWCEYVRVVRSPMEALEALGLMTF